MFRLKLNPKNQNKYKNIEISSFKSIPDSWEQFAKICTIRSGDKLVKFNPYVYQVKLIETIENHKTTIISKTRQLGITETISNYFLFKAIRNNGYLGVIFSKCQADTSNIAKRLRRTIEYLGEYCHTITDSLTDIQLLNGGRILFRNSSINGSRGLESVSDILFDEASFTEEFEQIFQASIPCTAVMGNKAKVIILSTPNGSTGFYYDKLANNNYDKNLLEICEQIKQDKLPPFYSWTDSSNWGKVLIHWKANPIFNKNADTYLEDIKKQFELPNEVIEQEFNLSFTVSDDMVFTTEQVKKCAIGQWEKEKEIDDKSSYYLGIDTSLLGLDYTVCTVLKSLNDKFYLVDMFRKRKNSNEVNIYKLSEMIERYNPVSVGIETNSAGIIYLEQLSKIHENTIFKQIKTTAVSKPVLINRLLLAIEKQLLILPNDNTVISEFLSFRRVNERLESMSGCTDDIVLSLSFALSATNFDRKINFD